MIPQTERLFNDLLFEDLERLSREEGDGPLQLFLLSLLVADDGGYFRREGFTELFVEMEKKGRFEYFLRDLDGEKVTVVRWVANDA